MPSSGDSSRTLAGSEKRATDRASITLRVDYKRLNTFFADYAKNISKGGTFIRTDRPLDVGTEFVFELSLPGREDRVQLLGVVMWVVGAEDASSEQHAGMGIRFKFDDDAERRRIEDFVDGLMREALGEHISQKLLARRKPTG
jgi:type IV pilus assembly protein PilZ